jgi:NADH:ubiquinone oxidoreductase subunit F (NADH-binding)
VAWHASLGTEGSRGTVVLQVGGRVRQPGLVEIPFGMTLRRVLDEFGGGMAEGSRFKAVQVGGPLGSLFPESKLDIPVCYDLFAAAGAILGHGGIVVYDDTTDMVALARHFMAFAADESCGKCVPCRIGTKRMLELLTKITEGKGSEDDVRTLERLSGVMASTSLCGLGRTAPNPFITSLNHFRDEYLAHIRERKCPAGVCTALISFAVIAEKCKACGLCRRACPASAIAGAPKQVHVIDPAKCVKCGACFRACKFKAIRKQ